MLYLNKQPALSLKNGIGSTTLTAYAYDNGVDVADKLQFRWSKDGHEFYVGKSVTVNATDVDTKAVYSFEAMENGIKRGYYEVTIADVMMERTEKTGNRGPQGEKGPQGATGATGPQGATGKRNKVYHELLSCNGKRKWCVSVHIRMDYNCTSNNGVKKISVEL